MVFKNATWRPGVHSILRQWLDFPQRIQPQANPTYIFSRKDSPCTRFHNSTVKYFCSRKAALSPCSGLQKEVKKWRKKIFYIFLHTYIHSDCLPSSDALSPPVSIIHYLPSITWQKGEDSLPTPTVWSIFTNWLPRRKLHPSSLQEKQAF